MTSGEALPAQGSVRDARRRLFQEDPVDTVPRGAPPLSPRANRNSRGTAPGKGAASMSPIPVDSSSIEDTSALINMFGGRAGGGGAGGSASSAGVAPKKLGHQAMRKHKTGPGGESPKHTTGIYSPQPQHKNLALTAARLASQLSPPASGRSSPAPPRTADGHDVYGISTIALHPGRRSSEATSRTRASMELGPRPSPPQKQVQPPPPQPPPPTRRALAKIQCAGVESDSDQDIYTDAPELPPPPRAAPAPPAPRRNRGPKRRVPGQASIAKHNTRKPPPPRPSTPASRRDSMPTLPRRASPKPHSRNPTGSISSTRQPQTQQPPSTAALLAPSPAFSHAQTSIPPAHPLRASNPTSFKPPPPANPNKKKPVPPPPPPPLRRRRSAPSISAIRSTMRPPPKRAPTPEKRVPLLASNKHRHKHSASTHPAHLSSSTITEKDRKRYEGVWAANRGYLMHTLTLTTPPPPPPSVVEMLTEGVHPLVARELWSRSRLSGDILGEIWSLVDRGGKGWLRREEFVVGMWLVDRGLRGRKVPMGGVSEGVWASVRRMRVSVGG